MLLGYSGDYEKITIGDTDDRRFTTIVNSASTALLIGLPPKGAKFRHTSNRLLVGHQSAVPSHGCILVPLRSVVGRLLAGGSTVRVPGLWEVPSKRIRVPGL
jgi:hypothetical protein